MTDASRTSAAAEVTAAVAIADAGLRNQLLEALRNLPVVVLEDNWNAASMEDLASYTARFRPGILFLGLHGWNADIADTLACLAGLDYPPRVVAVNDAADPVAILKAMRAGAAEFVYPPFVASFDESIRRVLGDCSRVTDRGPTGTVIGFVSAKGGCGATTVGCHTARYLKRAANKEVLLADLDLASGTADLLMQANGRYTLNDALQSMHRMDAKLWKALVTAAPSGVDVISPPAEFPSSVAPVSRKIPQLVRFWRNQYEFTVLDFGHGMAQPLAESMDSIDTLVMVTTNELPALRLARRMIQSLAVRNFGPNRLKLVVNRMPKRVQIQIPELETVLGHPIHGTLPNDYPSLLEAYSAQRLLDESSELGCRMGEFAANLVGLEPVKKKPHRFFAFRQGK